MEVFISWSQQRSHDFARKLEELLNGVFGDLVDPRLSDHIAAGSRWVGELARALESSSVGIVCLTNENLRREWLQFEAGALSSAFPHSKVVPVKVDDIADEILPEPLGQFQAVDANKQGIRKLLETVSESLPEGRQLAGEVLEERLGKCWAPLERAARTIRKQVPAPKGLVLYFPTFRRDPFYAELMDEIVHLVTAHARDMPIYLRTGNVQDHTFDSSAAEVIKYHARKTPGIVVLMAPEEPETYNEIFALPPSTKVNLITLDVPPEQTRAFEECDFLRKAITVDNKDGARKVAGEVAKFAAGNAINCLVCEGSFHKRGHYFREALESLGVDVRWLGDKKMPFASARQEAFEWVRRTLRESRNDLEARPTFVFCSNDSMSLGARSAVAEVCSEVPKEIHVISFDGSRVVRDFIREGYIWCSVDQQTREYAVKAFNTAREIIKGGDVGPRFEFITPKVYGPR